MKIFKLLLPAIASVLVLGACDSDNKQTSTTPDHPAKVISFNLTSDLEGIDNVKGLNTISYGADGRVTKSTTGTTETTYVYTGNKGVSTEIQLPDGSVNQTREIFFNDSDLVARELLDLKKSGVTGNVNYTYDAKGRLIKEVSRTGEGESSYIINTDLIYDEASGLVTRINITTDVAGEISGHSYTLEYTDIPNKAAFYPEAAIFFASNEVLTFTGFTGYSRDRLLSKATSTDENTGTVYIMTFDYDLDQNGLLNAIHAKWNSQDKDGNPTDFEKKIDYTDIKYLTE